MFGDDELVLKARQLRREALEMIGTAGSGHPGPALSIADIVTVLYYRILRLNPAWPDDPSRDRFVLSKGHGCAVLYAALLDRGFVSATERARFRRHGGLLQGHPRASAPGIEVTTGPLGLGASVAAGIALGTRGTGVRTVALLGDGELQAGIVWEAAMFAAERRLGNLMFVIDVNGFQYTGRTSDVLGLGDLTAKWEAFGWMVRTVDGHDIPGLTQALSVGGDDRPTVVLAQTIKGRGVSFMENAPEWHGRAPTAEELGNALGELA